MKAGPHQQPLNAMDRAMLIVDRSLRDLGQAGWETQTLVWLQDRIDVDRLRLALQRFAQCHPAVTARLILEGPAGRPVWEWPAAEPWDLHETALSSGEEQAVLDHAGRLMTSSPGCNPPLRVHLLRRLGAPDVVLLHYNHVLTDHSSVVRVLRQIDRCWHSDEAAPAVGLSRDPIVAYLQRFPATYRREATHRYAADLQLLRHGAVRMGRGTQVSNKTGALGLIARCLDTEITQNVQHRVQALGGMPSLSMTILGSVFRAVAKLAGLRQGRTDLFHAGIGVDLGLRGRGGPLLGNMMSMLSIVAASADLADRDELARLLSRQLRERIGSGGDLAMLRLATTCARLPRQTLWIMDAWLRYAFTLWYAYFGPIDPGERFCGCEIEKVCSAGPCWPAIGVTLLVNQFRGRLLFQTTYVPEVVPPSRAREFLDTVIEDLVP
jgi:hypothetical protein